MPSKRLSMPFFQSLLAILCLLASSPAWAAWTNLGTMVDTTHTTIGSRTPRCIADGLGGMFLAWAAGDSGNLNIYAQHLDAYGQKLWPASGVAVCTAARDQSIPQLSRDGAGGIFVVWKDARIGSPQFRLFAQRLNGAGSPRWLLNGIQIASSPSESLIVETFDAARTTGPYLWVSATFSFTVLKIAAQKVDSNGVRLWGPAGISLPLTPGSVGATKIAVEANQTAAYVAWARGSGTNNSIRAMKLGADGQLLWPSLNPAHTALLHSNVLSDIAPDGFGGATVAWTGSIIPIVDVFAQRFSSSGAPVFTGPAGALQVTFTSADETTPLLLEGTPGLPTSTAILLAWTGPTAQGQEAFAAQIDTAGAISLLGAGGQVTSGINFAVAGVEPDYTGGALLILQGLDVNGVPPYSIRVLRVHPSGTPTGWIDGPVTLSSSTIAIGNSCITSDGAGGALASWEDGRSSGAGGAGVYAMAVTSSGVKGSDSHWQPGGSGLSLNGAAKFSPHSVSDGAGGAIVVWQDLRSGNADVYAQRVDGDMKIHAGWPSDGTLLCGVAGHQYPSDIVSDGAGGSIAIWADGRDSLALGYGLYAQRVDSTGLLRWTTGGVAVCTAGGGRRDARLTSDGAGGAIAAWTDDRSGAASSQIYSQRISATGAMLWTLNGVAVTNDPGDRYQPTLISDFSNGAILTWGDGRGADQNIYAQRLNGSGSPLWSASGVAVCQAAGDQSNPAICPDSLHGAVIAWEDRRGGNYDIYALRITSSGTPAIGWTVDGLPICNAPGDQTQPTLISDFSNGALIAWTDARGVDKDIYEQHITSAAAVAAGWTANGNFVCLASGDQYQPTLISDFSNGSIVVWLDDRNFSKPSQGGGPRALSGRGARAAAASAGWTDLYAQRITEYARPAIGWPANGAVVTNITGAQTAATAVTDGLHGIIVAWQDGRDTTSSSVYATRLNLFGAPSVAALLNGPRSPRRLALHAYPNPSRSACTLFFQAPVDGRYEIRIVDVGGRLVRQLRRLSWLPAGSHQFQWDGRSDQGERACSGIYFAKAQSAATGATLKLVRIR